MRPILITLMLFCLNLVTAQTGDYMIKGAVVNVEGNPIDYANISILSCRDSSVISGSFSNEKGHFEVKCSQLDNYILCVSHVFYTSYYVILSELQTSPLLVTLNKRTYDLNEVLVTSHYMKQKPGSYKISLKGNPITKGRMTNELLATLPGVSNRDGLAINGVSGTKVYIDGREVKNMQELEIIQAENIKNIEVKYNAGSSYDALKQKGGVINISLIELPDEGYYGAFIGSIGIRPKYGHSSDFLNSYLNSRFNKLSFYNSASYFDHKNIAEYDYENHYLKTGTMINTHTKSNSRSYSFFDNLSLVYEFNAYHNLGLSLSYKYDMDNPKEISQSTLLYNSKESLESTVSDIKRDITNHQYQVTLNYNWLLNSRGSKFDFTTEYLGKNTQQTYNYIDTYEKVESITRELKRNYIFDKIKMFEAKANFSFKLSENKQLSVGGAFKLNKSPQSAYYEAFLNDNWWEDLDLSNRFNIDAKSYAGYFTYSSSIRSRWFYDLGLRFQSDKIEYQSYKVDKNNKKKYNNFFPNIALGYAINSEKGSNLSLSYEKNIEYIPYNEITPLIIRETEHSYTKGNIDLDISTAHVLKLAYSLNNSWNSYYSYYIGNKRINYITYVDNADALITYSMPVNSGRSNGHMFGIDGRVKMAKWWTIYISGLVRNTNVSYMESDKESSYYTTTFFGNFKNSFQFNKGWNFDLEFYGETKERIDDKLLTGINDLRLILQKTFFKDKLRVRINSSPIYSKRRHYEISKRDYVSTRKFRTSQTNFLFSIVYNFKSKQAVKIKRMEPLQQIQYRSEKK